MTAVQDTAPVGTAWRQVAVLAVALLVVVALYVVGVLLPYVVNDLHRLPLAEVASGAHDPKDLWPSGAAGGAVQLAGLFAVTVGPFVAVSTACGAGACTVWVWSRPGRHRLLTSLALVVVVLGSVAALLFLFSDTGAALLTWRLD